MIFKKISMCGFKSFADKTEVVFNRGIAMVVGPNGCGKSNILDAIRWVLGEQSSKMLRSGKMEDVIFNGCDSRKASGMAEVSLTFDNQEGTMPIDFNEVTITRRLFRSGESQYLINKTPCRLRDIHELFMDTGVGTSSYSIIEQGQMDKIINARPTDRREIFEEAAGITKYKARRKEALRKLDYTETNLIRLRDIIQELERQINSLSRQAQKARRYKALTEELEVLDCQLTLRDYNQLSEKMNENQSDLELTEGSMLTLRQRLESEEQTHQSKSTEWQDLDAHCKALREKKIENDQEINRITQANEFKSEKIDEIKARIQESRQGHASEKDKLHEFQELKTKWENSRSEIEQELHAKERIVQENREALDRNRGVLQELQDQSGAQVAREEEFRLQRQVAETRLVENQTQDQNLAELVMKNSEEIDSLKLQTAFEDSQWERQKDVVHRQRDHLGTLESDLQLRQEECRSMEEALKTKDQQLHKVHGALAAKRSRHGALEELKASYEGFYAGVRAVMLQSREQPHQFSGVIGVVSDVLKAFPDYETATEVALGNRIQHVLIERGEDTQGLISYLKEHRLGRVTFLPLDLMREPHQSSYKEDSRILGRLLDFTHFEERFRTPMEVLLGRYLVVSSLQDGLALLREGYQAFNLVTLQGELLFGNGMITGGEVKSSVKGVLTRENEIGELYETILDLEKQQLAFENEQGSIRENLQKGDEARQLLRDQVRALTLQLHDAERDLHKAEVQRDALQKRLDFLYSEMEKSAERQSNLSESRKALEDEMGLLTESFSQLQRELEDSNRQKEAAQSQVILLREAMAKVEVEKESSLEKRNAADVRIQELERDIHDHQNILANFENHEHSHQITMESLEHEIESQAARLEAISLQGEQLATDTLHAENNMYEVKKVLDQFEAVRKELQSDLDQLQEHHAELRVQLAELDGRRDNLSEHVLSRYHLAVSDISENPEAVTLPWEEVPERIQTLENRIRNLGNVNLESIEELEALQERHTFLDHQEKDLSLAQTQLTQVIEKINVTATLLFQTTFAQIKVNFQEMFHELFGGGKAELSVLDAEDPLDAGIDIIARPPGKRPQTISLLSGGEKALTAVALLFSLFKVKPSPFCILDELDAPLDDSNINRFTKVLKEFSKNTQFIVITHNKSTIRISDLLYGVTQEQRGISRVISIKFIDEDLDHLLEERPVSKGEVKLPAVALREDETMVEFALPEIPQVHLTPATAQERVVPEVVSEAVSGGSASRDRQDPLPDIPGLLTEDENTSVQVPEGRQLEKEPR